MWDGLERRKVNREERDMLIEIHQDVKHLVENFKSHVISDERQFKDINTRLKWTEKILWGCVGGFTLLQVALKFFK
mgnify:CR=1 FL=1